jgi:imidazoleglycerol-phosphate dehydratase
MERIAAVARSTGETEIALRLDLDGHGQARVETGIGFFDHMLTLMAVHGFFDLEVQARGDLHVDAHHTVEDVGLVLGDALRQALGDRRGLRRFGHAVTPMDEALCTATVDLSNRPFLVFQVPPVVSAPGGFGSELAREFFQAFTHRGGFNLHVTLNYGQNGHHILEAVFKAVGRSLDQAATRDARIAGVLSSKGLL